MSLNILNLPFKFVVSTLFPEYESYISEVNIKKERGGEKGNILHNQSNKKNKPPEKINDHFDTINFMEKEINNLYNENFIKDIEAKELKEKIKQAQDKKEVKSFIQDSIDKNVSSKFDAGDYFDDDIKKLSGYTGR